MKSKDFDCVEMKRKGAEMVQEKISNLSRAEEILFWQKGTADLEALQEKAQQASKENLYDSK